MLQVKSRTPDADPWPLTVAKVRDRVRLDAHYPDDEAVLEYIAEAVADIESRTDAYIARGSAVFQAPVESRWLSTGCFPRRIALPGFKPVLTSVSYTPQGADSPVPMDDITIWKTAKKGTAGGAEIWVDRDQMLPVVEPESLIEVGCNLGLPAADKTHADILSAIMLRVRQLHDGFDYSRERAIFAICARYRQYF